MDYIVFYQKLLILAFTKYVFNPKNLTEQVSQQVCNNLTNVPHTSTINTPEKKFHVSTVTQNIDKV